MRTVRIEKSKLQSAINENLITHLSEFDTAMEDYRKVATDDLKDAIKDIKNGEIVSHLNFDVPENHKEDYDRTLTMLGMSEDTIIELTEQEFNQYVMDDWNWKHQFMTTTANYAALSGRL